MATKKFSEFRQVATPEQMGYVVGYTGAENVKLPAADFKGATGKDGPVGPAGEAATIEVGTVETGASGSQAQVVNAGSANAARFNFTIPQGAPGPKGDTGAEGAQGPAGPQGESGDGSVLVQSTEPLDAQEGTVWIDTSVAGGGGSTTQQLSALPVGSLVVDKSWSYFGDPVTFRVVSQNHNTKDSGYPANATTLMAEKVIMFKGVDGKEATNTIANRQTGGNGRYSYTNLRQWLNSDAAASVWYASKHQYDTPPNAANVSANAYDSEAGFMTNLSAQFKAKMVQANVKVLLNSVDGGGSETVTDYIFLPSKSELAQEIVQDEGAVFEYFSGTGQASKRIAYPTAAACTKNNYTGTSPAKPVATDIVEWYTRTCVEVSPGNVLGVTTSGAVSLSTASFSGALRGPRIALNLANDTPVSLSTNQDGAYEISWSGSGGSDGWVQNVRVGGQWQPGGTAPVTANYYTTNVTQYGGGKEQEPVFVPLSWSNYNTTVGANQPYHPDIWYDSQARFGYKYVMCYTPYPNGGQPYRDRWECPCIAVSNNLVDWKVPPGLTNPLDELTSTEITNKAYFSDPCLVYNSALGRLELYYRLTANQTTYPTTMFRKTTTNLTTWSARETLYDCSDGASNGLGGMVRSQTMRFDGAKYHMWYSQSAPNVPAAKMMYSTSNDGKTGWTTPVQCTLSDGATTWHPDVKFFNGTYYLVNYDNKAYLTLYTSTNGTTFAYKKKLIELEAGAFYSAQFYKSSCTYNGHVFSMVFTAEDANQARFGLMQGKTMESLEVIDGDYFSKEQ